MPDDKVNEEWIVSQAEFKGFVKAKLEGLENVMTAFIEVQTEHNKDNEKKLDKIENEQSKWKGMMAGISIVGGILGGFVRGLFGGGK